MRAEPINRTSTIESPLKYPQVLGKQAAACTGLYEFRGEEAIFCRIEPQL